MNKSCPVFRWYFGKIKRIEAEKKLLLIQNEHGAYLIRYLLHPFIVVVN
jgi:fyn-related kinase